jgi:hypothetical protein
VRRTKKLDILVVAAVGVLVAVAAADALRSNGSSPEGAGEVSQVTSRPIRIQQVRDVGERWARHFADGACEDMGQPLCERIACVRPGSRKIKNCTPPTRAYRRSFDGVFVTDVAFKGDRAAALLSNGEVIELCCDGGRWLVATIGGNAGRGFWVAREATTDNRE